VAGIVIAVSAVLMIAALARHPTVAHRQPAAAIADIVRLSATDQIVHGIVIAAMSALLFALSVFSIRRDLRDQTVLGALVAFSIGTVAMIGAAIVDGFVVPIMAAAYAGAPPSALPGAVAVLRFCGAVIQAATMLGIATISVAILLWSIGLLRSAGELRPIGIVGGLVAALPAVVLGFGGSTLNPHLLGAIAIGQAVWYLGIGLLLVRGRI
jgi:hypothetical protein